MNSDALRAKRQSGFALLITCIQRNKKSMIRRGGVPSEPAVAIANFAK